MITDSEARSLVLSSLTDLKNRIGYLNSDDLAADVINVACKWILEKCPKRPKVYSVPQMAFADNYSNFRSIAAIFPNSVGNEYPIIHQNVENLTQNICLNIGWDGMPGFLEDYFYKKHCATNGFDKDIRVFMSSCHKRYQYGKYVEQSMVPRKVELSFSNGESNLAVSITPSLSRKSARLISRNGNCLIYSGEGYRFTVNLDDFDEVELFTLEIPDRQLKLEYYE
ncbi:hypothetical protein [Bacteroides sp.]|uniref:hypothetical protein n=1 Tax=Bacteroides sp. TaxID=29523 RepID=UPI00260E36B5|nr:hypothetical protein [Bacteroides sp.]